jgi:DNA-binding response OmpR family regulator
MNQNILVVDDDSLILTYVQKTLLHHGYSVETARDGVEGLEKALQQKPDLIISDILMPNMDGWTFIERLRSRRELMLVPVIFLTAMDGARDRFRGFRLGADDYLAKPVTTKVLLDSVKKSLRRQERLRAPPPADSDDKSQAVAFEGDLSVVGIATVLTILEMERSSGMLLFKGEREGRAFIQEGRLFDIQFEGQSEPEGIDSVCDMLIWKEGRFEFYYMEVDRQDRFDTSTTALLLEGARRQDEARRES